MGNYTREEILQMVEEEDVEFIRSEERRVGKECKFGLWPEQ